MTFCFLQPWTLHKSAGLEVLTFFFWSYFSFCVSVDIRAPCSKWRECAHLGSSGIHWWGGLLGYLHRHWYRWQLGLTWTSQVPKWSRFGGGGWWILLTNMLWTRELVKKQKSLKHLHHSWIQVDTKIASWFNTECVSWPHTVPFCWVINRFMIEVSNNSSSRTTPWATGKCRGIRFAILFIFQWQ